MGNRLGGPIAVDSFWRPADTTRYDPGDLVANSPVAGSVLPMSFIVGRRPGGVGRIYRARLVKSSTTLAGAVFDARFYRAAPIVAMGDNAQFASSGAGDWLGTMAVALTEVHTDGVAGFATPTLNNDLRFETDAAMKVYALLSVSLSLFAGSPYVPAASEKFTLSLEYEAD